MLTITRKRAATRAIKSSNLRKKISKPIPHQNETMIAREMVSRAAYPAAEKPSAGSAWSSFAVSAPGRLHKRGLPVHVLWSCRSYAKRLATKSPRLGTTSANHATRAIRSHRPDKRVCTLLETTAPPALFCSVFDRFMHLALFLREEKRNNSKMIFLLSSNQDHSIFSSHNR